MHLLLLLSIGCPSATETKDPGKADSDGDGLSDGEEADLGSNPALADSDADGLDDAREVELGTSLTVADSDGDTYWDSWEVTEGTNPLDAESRIYVGYWPYNPNKETMVDPGWDARAREGNALPRFAYVDQFGDTVDIYDFAGQGKPVLLDLSGAWCYYCQEVAKMIEGRRNYFDPYAAEVAWVDGLQPLIESGDLLWVTVLDADSRQNTIDAEEVAEWYDSYTNEFVPVLGDVDMDLASWINPPGYPTMMLLDENLVIHTFDKNDYTVSFDAALAWEYPQ